MKQILLKTWLMLCLFCIVGVGSAWAEVSTVTATTGKEYVVAVYSGGKYYALPQITTATTYSGTEVAVNAQGKVTTTNAPTWTLTVNTSNANQFYLTYKNGSSTYYLYKNGTSTSNYNIKGDTSDKNYWTFSKSSDGKYYNIVAVGRGTNHTYLNYYSSKWQVRGTSASTTDNNNTSIILLEVAPAGDPVATPTNLSAGTPTSTGTTLSWGAVEHATAYKVEYKVSTAGAWTAVTPNPTTNSCELTGLTPSTTYAWQVTALSTENGYSDGSAASGTNFTTAAPASHKAYFYVNGTLQNAGGTDFTEGASITFPADPSVDGVTFMGWTNTADYSNETDAPSDLCKAATMGDADVTFYAVFATEEEGGTQWKKVAASAVNSAGVYAIITTDGHAFNGTISSGHGQITSTAFSFDANGVATSAPDGTCEITFAAVTGGYTMYNASNGYLYASAASSGKLAWHNTESSYWLYKSSNWLYNSNSAYLRDYQDSSFRTYATNNGSVIQFAKKENSTTYSDYCTTVSLDPKPTIVLSASELAEYAGNTNTSITASVSDGEYTGALSVESSAEAVATASISEGTITINALTAGTTTITVTAPAVNGFRKNTATIAVTVSEKLAHGLAFNANVLNLTVGDTEFSEPTLSNPNNLPVVYSLVYATPGNEGKVATINEETGKLTLADPSLSTETQGAVTVKASTDGDNSHAAGEVTYNLVVARKVTTTSWSNEGAAVNIDKDEIATLPTASNDGERKLFYESSNEDVATIDNTGAVTFVEYGTTTITAKTSATAEYAATSATYQLTFAPRYTVTFNVNGNETELREETTGAGVTAPAVEPIEGKVFRGWAEATIDDTTNDAPTFITTATLDGDKTLYAVFATAEIGEDFELVENLANIQDGEAYIGSYINYSGSRYYVATNATDLVNATVTDKVLTIPANALKLTFVATGTANEFYIKNESGDYLNVTSSDWASFTSTACALTFSGSSPYALKTSTGNNYLRAYGSSATAGKLKRYASQTNTGICVFQRATSYSDYCTTVKTTPTLSFAAPTYSVTLMEAFEAPELTNPQDVTVAYSSSETSVATVNSETGAITLVGAGTTTITATFTGNATYKEASANYELVVTAEYTRDGLTANSLGTICIPYAVSAEEVEAVAETVAFYEISHKVVEEGVVKKVMFTPATELVAGMPYIFYTGAESFTLQLNGPADEAGNKNGLYGALEKFMFADTYEAGKYYVISNNKIQAASNKSGVNANRAYIVMSEVPTEPAAASAGRYLSIGANGFEFEEGTLTGIEANITDGSNEIYDLQGRRVVNAKNGMYIVNGKKVLR